MDDMKLTAAEKIFKAAMTGNFDAVNSQEDQDEFESIRVIQSTDVSGASPNIIDINEVVLECSDAVPYFKGPKLMFFSANTAIQARVNGGVSIIEKDWSFSFDSNVGKNISLYVNHRDQNPSDKERVISLLRAKRKYNLQTDFIPFIFENIPEIKKDRENKRPLESLIAFKRLDYIDWDSFEKNPYEPVFHPNETQIRNEALETLNIFMNNSEVERREYMALATRVLINEMAITWYENNRDPVATMVHLLKFCLKGLCSLMKFELIQAAKFVENPGGHRFFQPIADKSKECISKIRGMAWDMVHFRSMESASSMSTKGSFFIPYFVTFDQGFKWLIENNLVDFMVFDDHTKKLQTGFVGEQEKQNLLNKYLDKEIVELLQPEQRHLRAARKPALNDLRQMLQYQIPVLEKLLGVK